ncbi:hypothetical protein [Escherichia phage vB_EcoP_EP32B]|nr:hypothetical protein [Escherichia phage vB_EcoP_EP32B]
MESSLHYLLVPLSNQKYFHKTVYILNRYVKINTIYHRGK